MHVSGALLKIIFLAMYLRTTSIIWRFLCTTGIIWRFLTATMVFTVGARTSKYGSGGMDAQKALPTGPIHDSANGSSLDEEVRATEWRLKNMKCILR